MKCKKCGAILPDTAKFCVRCGAALAPVVAAAIPNQDDASQVEKVDKANVDNNAQNQNNSINNNSSNNNTATNEASETNLENEQLETNSSSEESINNTQESPSNSEISESKVEQQVEPNQANNNQVSSQQTSSTPQASNTSTSATPNAPKGSFGATLKKYFVGVDQFFFARSVLMYAIIGGSMLALFIIGVTLGWSALMLIPLTASGLALLGYLQEIKKIEIKPESLRAWNESRPNNVIFKKPITNPDTMWSKLQYWHFSFKLGKTMALVLTVIALVLPHGTFIAATTRGIVTTVKALNGGGNQGGGEHTYVRKYEGFYPDAEYVVKYDKWNDLLYDIWDPIGLESYNHPMGSSVNFTIASEYRDQSELDEFRGLVLSYGYTFEGENAGTTHNVLVDGEWQSYYTPGWTYKKEWGPSTTWQEHRYHCSLSVKDQGYSKDYKAYYVYMEYLFFNYGPNE